MEGFLENWLNSRSGVGNVQNESGTSCHATEQNIHKKTTRVIMKFCSQAKKNLRVFFKDFIYLFMRDRERERERQRHRQREKQAVCREPNAGLNPGTLGS